MSYSHVIDSWIAELAQQPRRQDRYARTGADRRDRVSGANRALAGDWSAQTDGLQATSSCTRSNSAA